MEDRLKSHYESLARAITFVRSADRKAAPVLGLQIALVGTLAARFENLQPIVVSDQLCAGRILLVALIGLYLVFLLSAVVLAALVYIPINPTTGKSIIIYFEDISTIKYKTFEVMAKKMTPEVIEAQLIDQIHRVSKVASTKMHRVKWAFLLTAPTTILWLVLMVWGSF